MNSTGSAGNSSTGNSSAGSSSGTADREWVIAADGYRAVISSIGATLRELTYLATDSATSDAARDLIVSYPEGSIRPLYRGALIAPWPNRIADGRYSFGGQAYQVPINEVDRHHALHGLVQWVRWTEVESAADRLVLEHLLVPQDGYPFPLHLRAEFAIGSDGLETILTTSNIGEMVAPYGCCPHPYLVAGVGTVDDWSLEMPADTRLEVDDRLIPIGTAPVDQVGSDFRTARAIGEQEIDHAFTDLQGVSDRFAVRVRTADGSTGVQMSWGTWGQWLQIHTADRPEAHYNRVGLAVEPMSCAPNAFNSADGAPVIEPGAVHRSEWTISALTGQ